MPPPCWRSPARRLGADDLDEAQPDALRDDRRRQVRRDPRVPGRDDRPPAARRHPLAREALHDLHHRRLLDGRRPLDQRRAPARPRRSTSSRTRPPAEPGTTSTGSPSGPSRSRTSPAPRSAGSATTATPTTAAATTCISRWGTPRPGPAPRRSWSSRSAARIRSAARSAAADPAGDPPAPEPDRSRRPARHRRRHGPRPPATATGRDGGPRSGRDGTATTTAPTPAAPAAAAPAGGIGGKLGLAPPVTESGGIGL